MCSADLLSKQDSKELQKQIYDVGLHYIFINHCSQNKQGKKDIYYDIHFLVGACIHKTLV